jgi:hypothetical protein
VSRTGGRTGKGDDPGLEDAVREEKIRELEDRLAEAGIGARERNRILRRLKELRRRKARRSHGADR